jgi:ribosome assembly protein YihI (activator of Der GTPase)
MFRTDCKKFYNLLREKKTNVENAPTKEETENFWKEIFGKKVQHNTGSKSSATKSQYGKKRNISNDGHGGSKNDVKLEISWKRPNSTFLSHAT